MHICMYVYVYVYSTLYMLKILDFSYFLFMNILFMPNNKNPEK